jgi:hypothetical protein
VNDAAVFGPIVTDEDVQAAVAATLQKWMPTYLALIERKVGLAPKSLPVPKVGSYVLTDDGTLNKKPEDQLPAIVVLTPGVGKVTPKRDGSGKFRAGFVVNVAAIVSAKDQPSTSALAKRYRKALELILIQQPSLGGFAEGVVFQGWRTDDLRSEDDRTIAAGTNVFEVLVAGIAEAGAGLLEPLDEPYEETDLPTITEVTVDIEPEGL